MDLTTYEAAAPLTRDPAMLLLSIVARRVPGDPSAQEELFDQLIRGGGRDDLIGPHDQDPARWESRGLIAEDFRDDWLNQLPLSLPAGSAVRAAPEAENAVHAIPVGFADRKRTCRLRS
ncbi:hypothetical protein ABT294_29345 [Nonomuraea sp. NPDC000554]|uniref:hypothetical protein n=1 Tax=Nonomuraea sp. NPDC000554 TaxID=3154259 RepID=UPI003317F2C8